VQQIETLSIDIIGQVSHLQDMILGGRPLEGCPIQAKLAGIPLDDCPLLIGENADRWLEDVLPLEKE
jgi:hypothetical protein